MYHFTHDYKHRLHIHMHASVLHIIYSTHTHGYNIIMHRHTYVGHIIAHTPHSVHNTHRYSSQIHCGIIGMLNYYSMKAKTITMVNILLIVDTLIDYIDLHTHPFTY